VSDVRVASEAKNNLSALLHRVRDGDSVLIVDRGLPVARLEPIQHLAVSDDDRLARLVRQGVVRPARGAAAAAVLATAPPSVRKGASALRALLDERREGR
jgi:prevent-host-death family protein